MLTLVANLGSTSFKYKLFDMPEDSSAALPAAPASSIASAAARNTRLLASGSVDRIGQGQSAWSISATIIPPPGSGGPGETKPPAPITAQAQGLADLHDHAAAIDLQLDQLLKTGVLPGNSLQSIQAIGFKAVHGGPISGAVLVDENVLAVMEEFSDVAPQHNPPYIAAMKEFAKKLPGVPQVAAFETAFHQTIPLARQVYAIPHQWTEKLGIRRYGFHGASHRYIATRCAEKFPRARKIISVHLGGSCSVCAIRDGKSVANSFGMTAQSGVFHASRVGDFDTFALLKLLKSGLTLDEIFHKLGKESGLLGISGLSSDLRKIEAAATPGTPATPATPATPGNPGNPAITSTLANTTPQSPGTPVPGSSSPADPMTSARARLALDAFVEACRHYIAAYLGVLNGADVIVFTGGIGQFAKNIRREILANFDYASVKLSFTRNSQATGVEESLISDHASPTQVWVIPTNEELIVARQTVEVLRAAAAAVKQT